MKANYRLLLLLFAMSYAGLALVSLKMAMNLAQDSAARCVSASYPIAFPSCLSR
ncbi:hypothetical protein OU997_19865 [Pseudomonas sp. SL4(2022)]|uniref:hypothetical protein n=1 Tax=unclassified Pseudomonas TaxID=196821 RepID=UPI0013050160|nr:MULTISPECIES: hypothetical protein [unclassified Pseudomonas]WAC44458.1 hypothetical protein OU997_19865 [Pseudomonas sp. SL4(2022)]